VIAVGGSTESRAGRDWRCVLVGALAVLVPVAAGVVFLVGRVRCMAEGLFCGKAPICNPQPLQIVPAPGVRRGQFVTIVSTGYACRPDPVSGTEQLTLSTATETIASTSAVIVNARGAFRARLQIPATAAVGPAYVEASGPTNIHCIQGACGAYATSITISA
jgi:hypothetical protein